MNGGGGVLPLQMAFPQTELRGRERLGVRAAHIGCVLGVAGGMRQAISPGTHKSSGKIVLQEGEIHT